VYYLKTFAKHPAVQTLGIGLVLIGFLHFYLSWNIFYFGDPYYFLSGVQHILTTHIWFPVQTMTAGLAIDKPPLLFWLGALSAKVLGFHYFALRLPVILFSLGIGWLWFHFIYQETKSKFVAFWSTIIPMTSFSYLAVSREFDPEILALFFNLVILLQSFSLAKKPQLKKIGFIILACFGAFLAKSGYVLVGLIPAISYLLLLEYQNKSKSILRNWILKKFYLVSGLVLGGLAGFGILLFYINHFDPKLIGYLFKQGNVGKPYLSLGFHYSAILYLLIVSIPWSLNVSSLTLLFQKKLTPLETFFKITLASLFVFFLFIFSRDNSTNFFLIMAFPLAYFIAREWEISFKDHRFKTKNFINSLLIGLLLFILIQNLLLPSQGANYLFQKYYAGIFLSLFLTGYIGFQFYRKKILLNVLLGIYFIGVVLFLSALPDYQNKYETYAQMIPYFQKNHYEKVYLIQYSDRMIYPSFIKYYQPQTEYLKINDRREATQAIINLGGTYAAIIEGEIDGINLRRLPSYRFKFLTTTFLSNP
jgi:4-amino-4-deoxy-L-arabinose transferase-like glycosyltransferase